MIERSLKFVQSKPSLFRFSLIIIAPLLPLLWVGCVLVEEHRKDPFYDAYPSLWEAFKKGEKL